MDKTNNTQGVDTPARDERIAFEAWMQTGELDMTPNLERDGEFYEDFDTQRAWRGWQARAALATAPEKAGEPVEMALCSTEQVFLKPNQLYRFYVKEGCAECARVANPASAPPPASTNRLTDWEGTAIANELWQIADQCGYEQFRDAVAVHIKKAYQDGWGDHQTGAASVTYGDQK